MTDQQPRWRDIAEPADIARALGLLTRLPVPVDGPAAMARGARAAWAWPLAGAILALIAGGVGATALWWGVTAPIAAGLILATQIILTGALHEDGLADSADGLWGGHTRDRRLEIMKDSRIGTFGVLALILSVGLRWVALSALIIGGIPWAALIGVAMLSRWPMVALMAALPPARPGGLSAAVGRPPAPTVWLAGALAILGLILLGWSALPVALAVLGLTALIAAVAQSRIGGQTGDILGASQQVTETAALILLTAAL
jgi:adenosylcobinamide-GDP ribazoletransferase